MKRFLRNNGLSLTMFALFLIFWAGQAIAGWRVLCDDEQRHHGHAPGFSRYLFTGHFWQATAENWESEFLQMSVYVVFTCFLYQKGSAESKDPDRPEADRLPEDRQGGFLHRNSLSLALGTLFAISFLVHGLGGWCQDNEERTGHGLPPLSLPSFVGSARFWFQSFQNWQSEFLAVLSIVVLSIFLRQHGSPESKPLGAPHSQTGG